MHITKLGHSCVVVEEGTAKILIDPGAYSTTQNEVRGLAAIIVTQEHPDHLDLASLKQVLASNPGASVITNRGVGSILAAEGIAYQLVEDGQSTTVGGVTIEGYGDAHAPIYAGVKSVVNTGYLIGGKFYHPGDALHVPARPVAVLALPVVAPWLKLAEALDYAKAVKPKACFPIHDGVLKIFGPVHKLPEAVLEPLGIHFFVPELGVPFAV